MFNADSALIRRSTNANDLYRKRSSPSVSCKQQPERLGSSQRRTERGR